MPRPMLAFALLLSLASGRAEADQPTYVGTWASDRKSCRLDQSNPAAPLILGRRRYDQHEAHCTFGRVTQTGAATWRTRARCTVEGDRQADTFTFTVSGDRLELRDSAGVRRLRRCG